MRFSAGTVCTPRPSVWCSAGVSDRPHSTEDDLYTVVRPEIGAISRQAVYDTLAALTDKGLRRIQPAGSPGRYESRVGDNHHHHLI
jgi:Fur family ferric uptake transcriptional regulator